MAVGGGYKESCCACGMTRHDGDDDGVVMQVSQDWERSREGGLEVARLNVMG